jgi:hypothetical protein
VWQALSGNLPVRAMLLGRGACIQDLKAMAPEGPQSLCINETDHHLGSDSVGVLLHRIDHSRRNVLSSDNSDRNDCLRKLSGECLGFKDGLREQWNHPIATPLRGSLDLNDVLAPSTFHDEVGLWCAAGPRTMDAPGCPTKSVGYKPVDILFSGSHDVLLISWP